jgi:UDP-N-acetylglucosamine 2-epimerase
VAATKAAPRSLRITSPLPEGLTRPVTGRMAQWEIVFRK